MSDTVDTSRPQLRSRVLVFQTVYSKFSCRYQRGQVNGFSPLRQRSVLASARLICLYIGIIPSSAIRAHGHQRKYAYLCMILIGFFSIRIICLYLHRAWLAAQLHQASHIPFPLNESFIAQMISSSDIYLSIQSNKHAGVASADEDPVVCEEPSHWILPSSTVSGPALLTNRRVLIRPNHLVSQ